MPNGSSSVAVTLTLAVALAACAKKQAVNANSNRVAAAVPAPARPSSDRATSPPAPTPPPVRTVTQIPSGTTVLLHLAKAVCTNTSKVGQHLWATVAESVRGADRATLPAGSRVKLKVVALRPNRGMRYPIEIGFEIETVHFAGSVHAMSAIVTRHVTERESGGATATAGAYDGCVPKGSNLTTRLVAPIDVY